MGFWGAITRPLPRADRIPLVVKAASELNKHVYRLTGGRVGGRFDRAPVCILHHVGAKSGQPRETPLVYLRDGDDVILVASLGGAVKNPAWYHNLRANPDVEVEIGRARHAMRARVAGDEERARLWPRVLEIWPNYQAYQDRTERKIPVIVLEPR